MPLAAHIPRRSTRLRRLSPWRSSRPSAGAHPWVEIAQWGHAHHQWRAAFLDRPHGIPSHETVGRVFALRAPTRLQPALTAWMSALADRAVEVIALDGNTIRRSWDRADGQGALHVVSAWASPKARGLAPFNVDDTSHAITALPELLALLNLQGRVVTIDAMGGQVEIARQIIAQGGAYVLSLQENQPGLHGDGAALCPWLRGPQPLDEEVVRGYPEQVAGGHGRIETRKVWRTEALAGLETCERWPGLATLVMGEATRQLGDRDSRERRYDISSLPGTTDYEAKRLTGVIRTQWDIEHRGHWVLDVAMGEDTNRTRTGESAQHLALIRTLALNLVRRETSVQAGIATPQKRAG